MDRIDAPPSVDDQAIQWFVLLRDDEATEADRAAFATWLRSDPSHEASWHSLERMWSGLDVVGRPRQRRRHRHTLKRAVTAAVVLLVVAGLGWQMIPVGLFADHRTSIGERKTITLEDGSQIELGTATALDVSFKPAERRIKLLTGEAFFTVAKDSTRPFIVTAGRGEVKVLGTAFDVKFAGDVRVAVAQSRVQVGTPPGRPVEVTAGHEVRYGAGGLSAVTEADLDAVQAWRQNQLVFRDVPLSEVLAELGRYRRGSVLLLGGALGQRHVTAVFDTHDTDAALDIIAQSLSLRIYRATSWLTLMIPTSDR
ncbi:FecR family protein [Rhodopseudomonas sp. HC1]|uniref:FecR family protein n=1 Tax=Rhodopseudomonas infernalis TaxID=2897386 RepID=UPI001EE8AD1F|nr:FecR family protein [Rhodopseudomonas infernalis]MCG6206731.1 FecR family protein [Rhodopseudomonas infernalis]